MYINLHFEMITLVTICLDMAVEEASFISKLSLLYWPTLIQMEPKYMSISQVDKFIKLLNQM